MELLSIKKSSENYVSKILDSNYIQTYNVKKKANTYCEIDKYYSSIDELIISLKEPDYLLTDTKDLFLNKIKLDIANKLDEDKNKYYDKYNYSKQFNTNVIQSGLQDINMLSTLIYLSDYYNINVFIYHKLGNEYYNYIDKNEKNVYVIYDNTGWILSDTNFDLDKIDILSMHAFTKQAFINNNLKNKNAYKSHLQPISKYKMTELTKIAEENNVLLVDKNGKKKIKQKLYDDINYKYI
tara:strand:- start:4640 stop:5356 length:717 start_codon:yes stop_codon:yes gene_type:complete